MAHELLAPWAEIVPGVRPMTADGLLKLPEDGWRYELVNGVLVRMPSPGYLPGKVVGRLAYALMSFVIPKGLGDVLTNDTGFLLSRVGQKDTVLGPDIAFVDARRVPPANAADIIRHQRLAPDLAAEVVSPDQHRPEMADKAKLYLASGVRLVWIVWPQSQTMDVWRPGSDAPVMMLTVGDGLDGLDVIPGFTYPLADLFS